jgi:hypothetical protein
VYACGHYIPEGPFIMYLDGNNWRPIDGTIDSEKRNRYNVISVNPRTGKVYVGGSFKTIGGQWLNNIARWDPANTMWMSLGDGVSTKDKTQPARVAAIEFTQKDEMIVGGYFQICGGNIVTDNVAMWTENKKGGNWSDLSGGVTGTIINICDITSAYVRDLSISGNKLYVNGRFSVAGKNISAHNIAAYDLDLHKWFPGNE